MEMPKVLVLMLLLLRRSVAARGSLFAGLDGLPGLGLGAFAESVAETAAHNLQVAHAAGASGLPPLGLDGPVVCG